MGRAGKVQLLFLAKSTVIQQLWSALSEGRSKRARDRLWHSARARDRLWHSGRRRPSRSQVREGFSSISLACFCIKPFARFASSESNQGS
jgi:hypothetical protein